MSRENTSTPITRYVALDIHRDYLTVGAVDSQQQIVLTPRRFGFESFAVWAATHVSCSDAVVLEATANAWVLYDQLTRLSGSVTVAHPLAVTFISAARVKTDARDTIKLARLLAAHLIPAVWVPPIAVREVRALVTHRNRLVKQRIQARNRLQGVLQRQNLSAPEGKAFALKARAWWLSLKLSPAEQLRVRQDLALEDPLDPLIAEVEAHVGQLSTQELWNKQVPFLLQLPGVGMLSAMTAPFRHRRQCSFSLGQAPGAAMQGLGHVSMLPAKSSAVVGLPKKVARELRTALVEAAWIAVEENAHWKGQCERLSTRIGKHKAIVAIARTLLVAVWHVLSRHCADIHGSRAGRRTHIAPLVRALWHNSGANDVPRPRSCVTTLINSDAGADPEEIHYSGRDYRLKGAHREGETRLRAFLLPFLSGLRESTTPLLAVSTRALRAAPLRCAGLDTARACAV